MLSVAVCVCFVDYLLNYLPTYMYYAINCMHDRKHMGVRVAANKKIVFVTLIGFIIPYEASFLTVSTNLLCLWIAQMPIHVDLEIWRFSCWQQTTSIINPLLHMHALGFSVLRITTSVNESDKNEHYGVYMFAGVSSYEHSISWSPSLFASQSFCVA